MVGVGERGTFGRLGYACGMDEVHASKMVYWITQFWSFFGVVFGVYLGGEVAKRVASALGYAKRPESEQPWLYRVWSLTLPWHPFVVGSFCGLVPGLPVAEWVPGEWPARMLWFGIAGAVSGQIYTAIKRTWSLVPRAAAKRLGLSDPPPSDPPPPAGGA